jgi:hypothetical protein
MLKTWLVILGMISMGLVVASCGSTPQTAAAMAGAAVAQQGEAAATQVATATTQAATLAAQQIEQNAIAIAQAVETGSTVVLPTLPDDGQVFILNAPTYTYINSHGQQYIIPKPKPPAHPDFPLGN